jgi:hypothetical protein
MPAMFQAESDPPGPVVRPITSDRADARSRRIQRPDVGIDRRVLSFVVESIRELGYAPTLREIQAGCALRSLRSAQESLLRLERAGLVRSTPKQARSLEVLRVPSAPPAATADGSILLRFFSVTTHGFYPHICRAAALAPNRIAAEGWLSIVMDRLRHVDAIDQAIARRESANGPIGESAIALVDQVWDAYEEFLEQLSGWLDWVVMEEYSATLTLHRGFAPLSVPSRGTAATVLEGQFEVAVSGRRFVTAELARLAEGAADLDQFEADLTTARRRVTEFYRDIADLLDLIWETPDSFDLELT